MVVFRSKSDLLYYAEYLPTISTQLKIISSVKAATPSDISVSFTIRGADESYLNVFALARDLLLKRL